MRRGGWGGIEACEMCGRGGLGMRKGWDIDVRRAIEVLAASFS
jgi:hypothetical protein